MSSENLRHAAAQGQMELFKRLLENGSNPCSADDAGATALHHATWNGQEEAVKILSINDRGTDEDGCRAWALQQQTIAGWTALHVAAFEGLHPIKCIHALLAAGIDPEITDLQGRTAADLAEEVGEKTNSETRKTCALILRHSLPSREQIIRRRAELKEEYWCQQLRRNNGGQLADFKAPVEARAPITPDPLHIAEKWHIPFAKENFQAVRGAYGSQAIRNLVAAEEEASANALRRFQLAHSKELKSPQLRAIQGEVLGINLDRSFPQRVARDDYGPFHFAAKGLPQTEAQKHAQEYRQDSSYPFHNYAKIRWLEAMNLESYWE